MIVAVDDLFFAAKIRTTAEHLSIELEFPRTLEALIESATRGALVIVDLHSQRYDPFVIARSLKSVEALHDVPLVGFFSHVQTELLHHAKEAGFDHVLPRSAFTKRLLEILQGQF